MSFPAAVRGGLALVLCEVALAGAATTSLIDPAFDPGAAADDVVHALTVQSDGNVERAFIVRLLPDGEIDRTFNADLPGITGASLLTVEPNGRMLASVEKPKGFDVRTELLRLEANGSRDLEFNIEPSSAVALDLVLRQIDGKYLVREYDVSPPTEVRLSG